MSDLEKDVKRIRELLEELVALQYESAKSNAVLTASARSQRARQAI